MIVRGRPSNLSVSVNDPSGGPVIVRQAVPPDLDIEPRSQPAALNAVLRARRRGRKTLPAPAVRREGPFGLARWDHAGGAETEVLVYPDLPGARHIATAVRRGRFREPGHSTRGPLGLGTEFESIRDYLPDDDIRQVNWRATGRVGRPMSNQYRVEQDRDVLCLVDAGRLMSAPLGDETRLDVALDAVAAVSVVAEEVGDRCGVLAFDSKVRASVLPRRMGARAVVDAVFDLEPVVVDSDYELAFRKVGGGKRSLVMVFTDLIDEAAARSLIEALPVLSRRHAVVVAGTKDPDLEAMVSVPPTSPGDVYPTAVALRVLEERRRTSLLLERAGAEVLEAAPAQLAAACVGAYLRVKRSARL